MKTIAFVHQKGGTGKTTACVNIAGCLVKQQKKVLLVDMDPQGSATSHLGLTQNQDASVYQVLMEEEAINRCIFETESGIYLLPSAIDLLVIDSRFGQSANHAHRLKNQLAKVAQHFDVILIDTPAGHTSLIVNAIIAAEGHLIIPMDSGVFAYESLETFNFFLNQLAKAYQVPIHLMAVLLREELPRFSQKPLAKFWKKAEKSVPFSVPEADITAFWEKKGLKNVKIYRLPYSYELVQSQIKGMPLVHCAPDSDLVKIYQQITTALWATTRDWPNNFGAF